MMNLILFYFSFSLFYPLSFFSLFWTNEIVTYVIVMVTQSCDIEKIVENPRTNDVI